MKSIHAFMLLMLLFLWETKFAKRRNETVCEAIYIPRLRACFDFNFEKTQCFTFQNNIFCDKIR